MIFGGFKPGPRGTRPAAAEAANRPGRIKKSQILHWQYLASEEGDEKVNIISNRAFAIYYNVHSDRLVSLFLEKSLKNFYLSGHKIDILWDILL